MRILLELRYICWTVEWTTVVHLFVFSSENGSTTKTAVYQSVHKPKSCPQRHYTCSSLA